MMSSKPVVKTPLKLYLVRISPCCRVVWFYLLQHKIPCEFTDVDVFHGEHREPKYIAMNPHEEVPILADGKTTVFGGLAILRYLSQKYTNFAGWGKAPKDRYRVQSVMDWASSKLLKTMLKFDREEEIKRFVKSYKFVYPQLLERYHLSTDTDTEELVDKGLAQTSELLETLENFYLQDHPFLCGSELTVADSYVATILCQAELVDLDFILWPRLSAWMMKVKGQEHWGEVHSAHADFLQKVKKFNVSSTDHHY